MSAPARCVSVTRASSGTGRAHPVATGEAPRPSSQVGDSRRSEMATKRKRKSNNPAGRPSTGLSDVKVLVSMSTQLAELVSAAASVEGVSRVEWIRRAMQVRLGEAAT